MKQPRFDAAWPEEVVEIWRNDMREMWDPRIERQVFHQYHNQLDLYLGLVEKYGARSVLDVGCAQGTLALLLAEKGLRVTAVDIRQSFLDYAQTRYERGDVRFLAANIFERPELGTFDLVFGNQIIEHLVYPAGFLRTLATYARPGGVLVVSTPNYHYFRSNLPSFTELGDPKQHEHRQFSAGGGDHFFAYTENELREAAAEAELEVLEMRYFETPAISGHALVRYLHWLPLKLLRAADRAALRVAPRKLAHQLCLIARRSA
ncbi:MAG TPA: methyltransferase domain-containing protein [Thermoanaerobaculia bacterium]|nr:methyltransferase domain-containing protein [Thermoanaerobaculia bacterium]